MAHYFKLYGTMFFKGVVYVNKYCPYIAGNDEKTKSEKYSYNLIWIMPAKGLKNQEDSGTSGVFFIKAP